MAVFSAICKYCTDTKTPKGSDNEIYLADGPVTGELMKVMMNKKSTRESTTESSQPLN